MDKIEILKKCTVDGNTVKLPNIQLDRKLYLEVAKALEFIGGKWNRKAQGFIFKENPTELLSQISDGVKRNLKKEFQFFETPDDIADWLVEVAHIEKHHTILEPSAGQGAIIRAIHRVIPDIKVYCYELNEINQTILAGMENVELIGQDFLNPDGTHSAQQLQFDRIIANPPFSNNQDIEHIREMYNCLKPGGIIASVTSLHWQNCRTKKTDAFMEWLETLEPKFKLQNLSPGSFKSSGTNIETSVLRIIKSL